MMVELLRGAECVQERAHIHTYIHTYVNSNDVSGATLVFSISNVVSRVGDRRAGARRASTRIRQLPAFRRVKDCHVSTG